MFPSENSFLLLNSGERLWPQGHGLPLRLGTFWLLFVSGSLGKCVVDFYISRWSAELSTTLFVRKCENVFHLLPTIFLSGSQVSCSLFQHHGQFPSSPSIHADDPLGLWTGYWAHLDRMEPMIVWRQVYKPLLHCAAQCRTPFDSCAFLLQQKLNWTQTLCCGGGAQASVKTCCLHLLIISHFLLSSSPCLSSSSSLLLITFNPVSQWCQNYHLGSSLGLSMCRSNPAP